MRVAVGQTKRDESLAVIQHLYPFDNEGMARTTLEKILQVRVSEQSNSNRPTIITYAFITCEKNPGGR